MIIWIPEFWPFPSDRTNVTGTCLWVALSHRHFLVCPRMFNGTEVRTFWLQIRNIDFFCLSTFFWIILVVIVYFESQFVLTGVLRCCFNIQYFFVMMRSVLWTAKFPLVAKHPHNTMLPPPYFTVETLFSRLHSSVFILQM